MSQSSDLTPENTIEGGTDGTLIGNVGDRLKVDALISAIPFGTLRSVSNDGVGVTFGTALTRKPILSLRKKAANLSSIIKGINSSVMITTDDSFLIEVIRGGTITGGAWTSVTGVGEVNKTSTAIVGGQVIYTCYVRGALSAQGAYIIDGFNPSLDAIVGSGSSDAISIVGTNITATATIYSAINYAEVV